VIVFEDGLSTEPESVGGRVFETYRQAKLRIQRLGSRTGAREAAQPNFFEDLGTLQVQALSQARRSV
jgi:hypothetical protein